jgi:uncharacterized protein (TIGR00375 family)
MKVIADLHIHSHYSRATSKNMNIKNIARHSEVKGLRIVATGDFTSPEWLRELQEELIPEGDTALYQLASEPNSPVRFMITTEVSTIYTIEDQVKKIHHVILTPNFETAIQINERLSHFGNLASDGRPHLKLEAPRLVEEVMEVSKDNMIFPAHAWTPWFGVLGACSGFNSIKECYQDMTKHIHALETGLSSDPSMNWRLSELDRFTLLSNSDCHSYWPWRLGREANVFELTRLSYAEIIDTIRSKDKSRFKLTIETDPAYGKYHWTGHRKCNVSLSPQAALKFRNICPVCRKELTKGVEQRIEEIADRGTDFKPKDSIGFIRLIPLSEIIQAVLNASSPASPKVSSIYHQFIAKFKNEYSVLIDAEKGDLSIVCPDVAEAIVRVREGRFSVTPGFDGVYGQLVLFGEKRQTKNAVKRIHQLNIFDFQSDNG